MIYASLVCGNPTTPCAGSGICDLEAESIDSDLAISTTISTNGEDLNITIDQSQLERLSHTRPGIHNRIANHRFDFGSGATPFYIDKAISEQLWPGGMKYNRIDTAENTVTPQPDGGVIIHFPRVTMNDDSAQFGATGNMIGTPIMVGKDDARWDIGTDIFGNLAFMDSDNMVLFGRFGNVSINRYSVRTDERESFPPEINGRIIVFKDPWYFAFDVSGNLYFRGPLNTIMFDRANNNIYFSGYKVSVLLAENPLGAIEQALNSPIYDFGTEINSDWKMFTDTNKNLVIKSPDTVYVFGTDGEIYVGPNHVVLTYFPAGGNAPE